MWIRVDLNQQNTSQKGKNLAKQFKRRFIKFILFCEDEAGTERFDFMSKKIQKQYEDFGEPQKRTTSYHKDWQQKCVFENRILALSFSFRTELLAIVKQGSQKKKIQFNSTG